VTPVGTAAAPPGDKKPLFVGEPIMPARCMLHDDAELDLTPGGRPVISPAELTGTVLAGL